MPESENPAPVKQRKRISRVERSRLIWEEVETAVRDLAIRRGWPHETFEDLDRAVRKLDEEYAGPDHKYWGRFVSAQIFKDNIRLDFMDMDEVKFFQPVAEKFVKEIEAI